MEYPLSDSVIFLRQFVDSRLHALEREVDKNGQEREDKTWSLPVRPRDEKDHPEWKKDDEDRFFFSPYPKSYEKEDEKDVVQVFPDCGPAKKQAE